MIKDSIKRLENLLLWSDRLGSDEVNEIKLTIKSLKNIKKIKENKLNKNKSKTVEDNNLNYKGTVED